MSTFQERAIAECILVGEGRADLAGIGIIVGFVGQATISLGLALWAFFFSRSVDGNHPLGSIEFAIEQKRLECVSDILMVGNDIQMIIGTSYMISVFSAVSSIDTYHLHFVFDMVSFVGVSSAAALVCWTYCNVRLHRPVIPNDISSHLLSRHISFFRSAHFTPRHRGTYLFAILYLVLTIILCLSLDDWSPDLEPGRCFFSHLVTAPSDPNPSASKIYVGITASWLIIAMLAAAFSGARWRHSILVLAFLQFPVHLYMALALRAANQGKLEGEAHENSWDFGQTTAVVLMAMAARELIDKGCEFYFFERDLRKTGALPKTSRRERMDGERSQELMGISSVEEGTGYYGASGAVDEDRSGQRTPLAMPVTKTRGSER